MLKAVITKAELAKLPDAVAALYAPSSNSKKLMLQVEAVDGFELADVGILRAEEDRLTKALSKHVIGALDSAVKSAGGNLRLLAPIVAQRARLDLATLDVAIFNEDGTRYYNNQGLPGTIEDLVDTLRKNPAFAPAFDDVTSAPKDAPNGMPAKPVNLTDAMIAEKARRAAHPDVRAKDQADAILGNPWRRSTWNLTQQHLLTVGDPARAARLRDEAARGGA